jgi:hypothetical protein
MDEAYSAAYRPVTDAEPVPDGNGWLLYCGTIIAIVGAVNAVYGIAAIGNSDFFDKGAELIMGSVKTWGWLMLIVGVTQLAAAFAIWSDRGWGRIVGAVSASINAIIQLQWLPANPLAALALFALDLLVIYGLIHGGRRAAEVRG